MEVTVRLAERGDAAAIRRIYNREVNEDTNTFDLVPRSLEDQIAWLDEHAGGHPAVVAVADDGAVVGFGALSTFRDRPAYNTTVEDTVYVTPEAQGQGAGRAILEELVRLAQAHGFHSIIARIVGGNEASVRVHQACAFEVVGTEREVGRKFRNWLDVVEMQRLL